MAEEKQYNSISLIINPPPYDRMSVDTTCPARLRIVEGPFKGQVWRCQSVIRAGRTKHARTHDFVQAEGVR